MVRKFSPFRSERKKRSTSGGTPKFPNGISGKLPYHLTSNRNFRIFWPNGKHPGSLFDFRRYSGRDHAKHRNEARRLLQGPEVRILGQKLNRDINMASGQEQELSLFELASAKLSDAQKLMTEARDLLKQDLNHARQEKSAIEEITKTLNEVHFASTIKLNVGGKIYKTTLDTLRKDPDSMLCAMFSGRFELKADEDDGAYFIDRDAELFR